MTLGPIIIIIMLLWIYISIINLNLDISSISSPPVPDCVGLEGYFYVDEDGDGNADYTYCTRISEQSKFTSSKDRRSIGFCVGRFVVDNLSKQQQDNKEETTNKTTDFSQKNTTH